jgi:DNA invertase Pin-like site-specific DNA recombinase
LQKKDRVIGYVRVSTTEQASNGVSLEEQRNRINGYAAAHGLEVVRIESDDGISGKTTANRPGLQKALRVLKRRKAGGLVVVKLDRLSRSLRDALDLVSRSEREGWELHSIGENLDTSTPHGRFVVHLFAALAQLEREQIGERTRNGMAELRRQGKRISRIPPFGFRFEDGSLVPVDGEQRILRRMRRLGDGGAGPSRVAQVLNEDGLQNPRTGRLWTPGNVGAIMRTAERRAAQHPRDF